ncbi:hypothetical protein [Rhizorhapis sp. SPR117]|uniref:hypothetical protein n=1 Tax=Rhizorhapis sp. SPR117 TaxID=2912611 RepID=UPI00082DDF95
MSLPVVHEPCVASDDERAKRMMLLAIDVSRKAKGGSSAKRLTLADMDEYPDFCRAADGLPPRNPST